MVMQKGDVSHSFSQRGLPDQPTPETSSQQVYCLISGELGLLVSSFVPEKLALVSCKAPGWTQSFPALVAEAVRQDEQNGRSQTELADLE